MSDELGRDEDLLGKKSVFNIKEKSWVFKVGAIAIVATIIIFNLIDLRDFSIMPE